MEFFKQNTKIRFMAARKWAYAFSLCIIIASGISLWVNGLKESFEFTGGTELILKYPNPIKPDDIRQQLKSFDPLVTNYGASNVVMVKLGFVPGTVDSAGQALPLETIRANVLHALLPGQPKIESSTAIDKQIGGELKTRGVLAMIVALMLTMFYIAFRFEYRFAISSTLALVHDPLLILGIFALFRIQFDLIALAAVLTVIGYSLNDTIVVFDRVRENFRKVRKGTPYEIVDLSINQTLSRTIMTSGLTLIAVVTLFIWGGPVVHGFALAMIIGIVIGTYSSIYVAGALALDMGLSRKDLLPAPKPELDGMP